MRRKNLTIDELKELLVNEYEGDSTIFAYAQSIYIPDGEEEILKYIDENCEAKDVLYLWVDRNNNEWNYRVLDDNDIVEECENYLWEFLYEDEEGGDNQ